MRWLLRALRAFATWLIALIILFEEWGWEPLARVLGLLAKLPIIGWLERGIARGALWRVNSSARHLDERLAGVQETAGV